MARPSLIPPPLTGNVYSLTQRVRFLAQNCQFSMYYRSSGIVNRNDVTIDMNDLQTYWLATVVPILRPVLSVGTTITDLRIWCMTWPDIATGIFSMANLLGTFAGDPLPPQIALVMTKRTNLRGKSGRGRMFLCGMSEDGSTNGAPTNAQLTAAFNLGAILKNTFSGGGSGKTFTPVVVSLKQYAINSVDHVLVGGVLTATPKPPPILLINGGDIVSVLRGDVWNTQRSRTFGRGE